MRHARVGGFLVTVCQFLDRERSGIVCKNVLKLRRWVKRTAHQTSEKGAVQTAHLMINGMTFDASIRSVQSALSVIRGVFDVRVSIADKEVTIRYDPHKVLPRQFETAVRVVGCEVKSLVVDAAE